MNFGVLINLTAARWPPLLVEQEPKYHRRGAGPPAMARCHWEKEERMNLAGYGEMMHAILADTPPGEMEKIEAMRLAGRAAYEQRQQQAAAQRMHASAAPAGNGAAQAAPAAAAPAAPSPAELLAAQLASTRALALFGLAELSATDAGRAELAARGFDAQAQAELVEGHEAEFELAQVQAQAARLVDEGTLARYARVQLGAATAAARTADDAAKVALALRRMPQWVLESDAARSARHAHEQELREARTAVRPSRQPGAVARNEARLRRQQAELDSAPYE